MHKQQGVTIFELMITLAIVAIVLTTVAPGIQSILIQNRIIAEINELSGVLQYARHNAIDQQANTVLCPTDDFTTCSNDWDDAKMVFMDLDGNVERGANEDILVASSVISDVNDMSGPNGAVVFFPSGAVSQAATLMLCHRDENDEYARALLVSLQGRVKTSSDDDNNGIHEDATGTQLDCG